MALCPKCCACFSSVVSFPPTPQLQQLGDIRRNAPHLIFAE
jgi:hypothetical protein